MFHDRLINEKDKESTQGLLKRLVEENFGKIEAHVLRDPCLFGDYRNALQVLNLVQLCDNDVIITSFKKFVVKSKA